MPMEMRKQFPVPLRTAAHTVVLISGFLFLSGERIDDVTKWFGLDKCYYRDPERYRANNRFPARSCLPGRITLVVSGVTLVPMQPTTRSPSRRNRILEVAYITSTGLVVWEERSCTKNPRTSKGEWQSSSGSAWYSVPGAEDIPSGTLPIVGASGTGMILRRLELTEPKQCGEGTTSAAQAFFNTFTILEVFIENRDKEKIYPTEDLGIYSAFAIEMWRRTGLQS